MRLRIDSLRRVSPAGAVELALLALIVFQAIRLASSLAAPAEPPGGWPAAPIPAASRAPPAGFDPFFRLQAAGAPGVVTGLDLRLHGIRDDRATGRGAAIIGLPGGEQRSFAVGEEIMPGVTLAAVAFDSVTISRGGTAERIFLDLSAPVETVGAEPAAMEPAAPPATAEAPILFQPRMEGGRLTGIVLRPGGGGDLFRAAGFAPGDVAVAIDGRPIGSLEEARARIEAGAGAVTVDRAGRSLEIRLGTGR